VVLIRAYCAAEGITGQSGRISGMVIKNRGVKMTPRIPPLAFNRSLKPSGDQNDTPNTASRSILNAAAPAIRAYCAAELRNKGAMGIGKSVIPDCNNTPHKSTCTEGGQVEVERGRIDGRKT